MTTQQGTMKETKLANAILFCKAFTYKGETPFSESLPDISRVYSAYKDPETSRYHILVGISDGGKTLNYIFDELVGENEMWSWDFAVINKDNILSIDIKDDDLHIVDNYLSGENPQPIFIPIGELSEEDEPAGEIYEYSEQEKASDEAFEKFMSVIRKEIEHVEEASAAMQKILQSDLYMAKAIQVLITYIASTYDDKYQDSPVSTEGLLTGKGGKWFNVGNSVKYCSRYLTEGYEKSYMTKDILKAAHYLLFENKRRLLDEKEAADKQDNNSQS